MVRSGLLADMELVMKCMNYVWEGCSVDSIVFIS